jgi:hypothetical protein
MPRSSSRKPHWYGIPVRVLLVTFIAALLTFAVSLLFGLVGTVVLAKLHSVNPDMSVAYRHVALPVAIVAAGVTFVVALIAEIRRYRETKTLSAIERMG